MGTPADPPLRIAMTVDPLIPVPPRHYGGIERIVAFLAEGLAARGHRVTLWAAPGSVVPSAAELIAYGSPPHTRPRDRLRELAQVMAGLARRWRRFDIVHSFGRLAGLLPLFPCPVPKIQSYQREIRRRNVIWAARLAGSSISFTACSTACRRRVSDVGRWETVYNGVRLSDYTPVMEVERDAPLMFLGRIERIKGVHTAIAVARATQRRLVIAGNVVDEPRHRRYFDEEIAPLVDGERIVCIGPVDDRQKNRLLGRAAALLMPIEWGEPFGIVMAEALACGTPVIGLRRGAVPEVIEHGVTGFVCETADEMIEATRALATIDRAACRARCERLFSNEVIVDAYETLYRRRVAELRR